MRETHSFFILVLNLDPAAEVLELTRDGHEGDRLLGEQIPKQQEVRSQGLAEHKAVPDVDIDLPAHGAGLNLEPAGVAGDVTVPALHDRRERDPRTDGTLEALEIIVLGLDKSTKYSSDGIILQANYASIEIGI